MNRRKFIQSCAAIFALPIMPSVPALTSTASASASAVPAQARFWAIYFSGLHGECAPQTLQKALNIPAAEARGYLTQLISDGDIKPNPFLKSSISSIVKTQKDGFVKKLKTRMELKSKNKIVDPELANAKLQSEVDAATLNDQHSTDGENSKVEFIDMIENHTDEETLLKS